MGRGPDAGRGHIDLVQISLGIGDEFGNGFGRDCWLDDHYKGEPANARDRRDVADEIETEIFVKRLIDCVR